MLRSGSKLNRKYRTHVSTLVWLHGSGTSAEARRQAPAPALGMQRVSLQRHASEKQRHAAVSPAVADAVDGCGQAEARGRDRQGVTDHETDGIRNVEDLLHSCMAAHVSADTKSIRRLAETNQDLHLGKGGSADNVSYCFV